MAEDGGKAVAEMSVAASMAAYGQSLRRRVEEARVVEQQAHMALAAAQHARVFCESVLADFARAMGTLAVATEADVVVNADDVVRLVQVKMVVPDGRPGRWDGTPNRTERCKQYAITIGQAGRPLNIAELIRAMPETGFTPPHRDTIAADLRASPGMFYRDGSCWYWIDETGAHQGGGILGGAP